MTLLSAPFSVLQRRSFWFHLIKQRLRKLMAKTSPRQAKKLRTWETDPEFFKHLRSLRLATCEEYLAWCERNGFSRRIDKPWQQRAKEIDFSQRAAAAAKLLQKREESRKPAEILKRIFAGETIAADVTQRSLRAICDCLESPQTSRQIKLALREILPHVAQCSDLICHEPAIGSLGRLAGNTFVGGLMAIARRYASRLRPIGEWKPTTHNLRRQFASLVRHLFAEWPVPTFMDSVWFSEEAAKMQDWFLHLGKGLNLRHCQLPILYTKRMAHHFMLAPPDFTVHQALRWGQVRSLGGSERLVRAVIGSRLGSDFTNDDFWITVIQFFVANPMLDPGQIGPIVDFIHHQRFVPQDAFPAAIGSGQPTQPHFSMKGRTAKSLLRQVEEWHRALAKVDQPKHEWSPSGIASFVFQVGTDEASRKRWTISELLSSKALVAEGRKMRHCVASYARSCATGACSIWTLELESNEGRSKQLTIEVRHAARQICQARGKFNSSPSEMQRAILRRWAEHAKLSLASHV